MIGTTKKIPDFKACLKDQIDQGRLLAGQRLPSERDFARALGVPRSRVKRLLDDLVEEGYVFRVGGRGTFVRRNELAYFDYDNADKPDSPGLTATLRAQGFVLENKVLAFGILEQSNYFHWRFEETASDGIFALHRLRKVNDEPVIIEYAYFPVKYFADADKLDFTDVSLYDYMASKGRRPEHFNYSMGVASAPEREAALLSLNAEDLVFVFEYVGFDGEGEVVEYTESYTRTDKTNIKFTSTFAP